MPYLTTDGATSLAEAREREGQRVAHLVLGEPRPKPKGANRLKKGKTPAIVTLAPGIEERVQLRERWSHKTNGTPETHDHAAVQARREGSLARLVGTGAIDAHQLAAADQIAEAYHSITAEVAVRTANLEPRSSGGGPHSASHAPISAVIRERAYPAGESDYTPASNLYGGFLVPTNGGAGSEIQGVGTRVSASAIDWTFPSTPAACTFIYSPNDESQVFGKGNDALALPMEPDAGAFAVPAATATPTVALSQAQSKPEGNSGPNVYTFTVNRSATSGAVNVPWSFSTGTTDASDYTGGVLPAGGTVAMADGVASGTFSVSVNGDATVEADETFGVSISAPTGYSLGSPSAITNTIANDDSAGATYTATGKSAKQHYASGASNPPGEQPAGFNSFIQSTATTAKALNDPAGAATGWSTFTSTKAGDLASNASGKSSGANTGVYPDGALIGNWYSVGPQVESYTGLEPTKYYKVYVCGSRAGVTNQKITAKVTGRDSTNAAITTAEQTLDVSDNTANRLDMGYVKPDASGNLLISWRQGGDTNAKLCVIELVEFTGP